MDVVFLPFYKRLMVKDPALFKNCVERMEGGWGEWDALLPCHGEYLASGGKEALRKHLE